MSPPVHDLSRFHDAQAHVFQQALSELQAGRKQTHWMWFVFPQMAGLGLSPTAQHYAIRSAGEARAYLEDPELGRRLEQCILAMLSIPEKSAYEILGSPDDRKLRSSLTLFASVADDPSLFLKALSRFYEGKPDPRTLAILEGETGNP
ncbi:DUF1810 domain-containing protein [Sinorhizobium sp. BG8]|uniref:DUF1810 domain-containing protein n=1 Tax=Sinorhizobium sp. BG8 TaxID=2613773 RepID=UPI00193DC230|nr:DUF1810 domain-containing protein [Sinorhizobium sp. BG8]QRM57534.1 DUF1810 domain-containing protein [Sinorhizobium sp. BG8]